MILVRLFLFVLVLSIHSSIHSQNVIDKSTQSLVDHPDFKHASISLTVMEVESAKIVSSHNPDLSISPASSIKVITTSTALAILGKDFKFKTELQYDGTIGTDGVLKGNIYIKGFGDPTLGADKPAGTIPYEELMSLFVKEIQKKGIKSIEGQVIADASFFPTQTTSDSWQWNDIGNYYGAGAGGLNINANMYELYFRQTSSLGQEPKLESTLPKLYNTFFINEVKSAEKGTGDNCYIYGAPHQNTRFLRGTIPVGTGRFKVKGSLPDPSFTAASLMLSALEKEGVSTSKLATTVFALEQNRISVNKTRKTIYTHYSQSLFDIAKIANEESINLYCESMIKMIGEKKKDEASINKGVEALKEFWEARGVSMDGFFMTDGSGLSARNGMTSKHFASILRKVKIDNSIGFDFQEALAIAGKTGTLQWMFKNSAAEGKIFGKTGSMDRIRSYTGYVETQSGKLLSFSIIINNYHCTNSESRKILEQWMHSLIKY